jgi:hypothetical protein
MWQPLLAGVPVTHWAMPTWYRKFRANRQGLSSGSLTIAEFSAAPCALQQLSCFGFRRKSVTIALTSTVREARDVDLALKLNVLVVCAVFTFVGAILLGAF